MTTEYLYLADLRDALGWSEGSMHDVLAEVQDMRSRLGHVPSKAQPIPQVVQAKELCVALGWQGGTIHLVIREIEIMRKRIAALAL